MTAPHPKTVLADLWRFAGQPADALDAVELTGAEPVLPSSFAVGTMAQTTIAAARARRRRTVAPAQRTAPARSASRCAMPRSNSAASAICRSTASRRRNTRTGSTASIAAATAAGSASTPISRITAMACWRCSAASTIAPRWRRRSRAGTRRPSRPPPPKPGWSATMSRSFAEWDAHPQGRVIPGLPLFTIERIGDAPPRPLPPGDRPLAGIRVLDLTRVIAGPVCGRTLASHGADVLLVTARHLPSMEPLVIDNGRGKLSTAIDLRTPDGRATLAGLLKRRRHLRAGLPARRHCRATASARRTRRASGPASSVSRSAPTAMRDHGPDAAASIRWCRMPTASTSPRRKPPATSHAEAAAGAGDRPRHRPS